MSCPSAFRPCFLPLLNPQLSLLFLLAFASIILYRLEIVIHRRQFGTVIGKLRELVSRYVWIIRVTSFHNDCGLVRKLLKYWLFKKRVHKSPSRSTTQQQVNCSCVRFNYTERKRMDIVIRLLKLVRFANNGVRCSLFE